MGFIGAGVHANMVHYPSLASMKDVEIVAICDINEERLKKTADKYEIKLRFKDYREMLSRVKLDAIYVIMPPHILYDIVVDCLKRGLNVFIEKPPGITAYQTESLAYYAEKYGCKTMVGFNRRFIPLIRKVRQIVEKYGPLTYCVSTFYKSRLDDEPLYYNGAVDILTCDAIHSVDMLRWMGGEVRRVVSIVKSYYVHYNNSYTAIMEFEKGAVGILKAHWIAGNRIHTFEMHSKGASAFINPDDRAIVYLYDKDEPIVISTYEAANSKDRIHYYGFYAENRHFIDCLLYTSPSPRDS